jgi:hypothetical protein
MKVYSKALNKVTRYLVSDNVGVIVEMELDRKNHYFKVRYVRLGITMGYLKNAMDTAWDKAYKDMD